MHQSSRHYQPRYRLVSQYPFQSGMRDDHYRGHVLEIGNSGVLVSPIGGDRYTMNGYYMLFVSVADAQLFVDALIAAVPAPPQDRLPTMYTEPLGQVGAVRQATRHPRYRLSVDDPDRMWHKERGKLVSYRGYLLYVTGRGCTISHLEYGPYQIDGYYVIFRDEQAARDHIDSWFDNGHTISPV